MNQQSIMYLPTLYPSVSSFVSYDGDTSSFFPGSAGVERLVQMSIESEGRNT